MTEALKLARRQIAWMRDMIRAQERIVQLLFASITPFPMTVTSIAQRSTPLMDFLKYRANFPPVPADTDVVSQVFEVTANGVAQAPQTVGRDVTSAEFEVPQNADVELKLHYVDDADNHSEPVVQSFVAVDSIAPAAPGNFQGIDLIGERHEDDPAPPVDPPVDPDLPATT